MSEITHENVVSKLQYILDETSVIESSANDLDMSKPGAEITLLTLEQEYTRVITDLPELIEFCAKQKPDPKLIGNRLRDSFTGTGKMLGIFTELRQKYIALYGKKLPAKISELE